MVSPVVQSNPGFTVSVAEAPLRSRFATELVRLLVEFWYGVDTEGSAVTLTVIVQVAPAATLIAVALMLVDPVCSAVPAASVRIGLPQLPFVEVAELTRI